MKTIKFLLTTIAVLLGSVMANAHDFEVDGMFYNILSSTDLTVEVTYKGVYSNSYQDAYSGEVIIPSTVRYGGSIYSVTSIGFFAFSGCSSLASVTIPNSVRDIGYYAFGNCSALSSVTIGNSVMFIAEDAFYHCSALTSIIVEKGNSIYDSRDNCNAIIKTATNTLIKGCKNTIIPNSVTSIGEHAFYGCDSLISITIPNSVTSIGAGVFSNCSSLTSVTLNSDAIVGKTTYDSNLGDIFGLQVKEYIIGESVRSIGDYAFGDCSSLSSVTIGNSVMGIAKDAFDRCFALTSIIVEKGNSIYDSRDNCNAIIKTATNTLIKGCKNTIIPNSVTSIGESAFSGCDSLISITIPNSVTSIEEYAFYRCSKLTSITIGNSVTSIGDDAFRGCSALTSVTIGNSVTSIGRLAFSDCSSLANIAFPNSVTDIGENAFKGCFRLGEVTLGSSIKNIAANAFAECTRLYDVYCYATYPPFIDELSFANYNVYLYVPCESQRDYTLDIVWGKFKFIECIDSEDVSTDGVVITPSSNDVTITWPTESNADTYTIVIEQDDEVFCTLTFNADGQLLNIAFAPAREGNNHPTQYAEQAGKGYRFIVTGLKEGTDYTYNITVKDAANKTIKSHAGEFTTEALTAVENTHSQSPTTNCQKIIRNGQLLILRDGVEYTIMGQKL